MKTTMGLIAATAATAYAGNCCCTYSVLSTSVSVLYRCNDDSSNANTQTQTFTSGNCNGNAATDSTFVYTGSDCATLSGAYTESGCNTFTVTGFTASCSWSSGAAEATLASAAAATAAVVGYTFA